MSVTKTEPELELELERGYEEKTRQCLMCREAFESDYDADWKHEFCGATEANRLL